MKDAWKYIAKTIEPLTSENDSNRYPAPHVVKDELAQLLRSIHDLDAEVRF